MDWQALVALAGAAVLSSGTVAALVGYLKDRRKDKASTASISVDAAGDAVETMIKVLVEVRGQLAIANRQLEEATDEIAKLRAEATAREARYALLAAHVSRLEEQLNGNAHQ